MKTTYRAIRCACGDAYCHDWHVSPVAARWGVSFTQEQAEAVAELLNGLAKMRGLTTKGSDENV